MTVTDQMPRKSESSFLRFLRSPSVKLFSIGFIILVLMIPLLMVWGVLSDRERRADDVVSEIGTSWGGPQRLSGPFLIVPFVDVQKRKVDDEVVESKIRRHAVFLPEDLTISGTSDGKMLKRSIFEVSVYEADMMVEGSFKAPDMSPYVNESSLVEWNKAVVAFGVKDVRAFRENVGISVDGQTPIPFEPSLGALSNAGSGIHAALVMDDSGFSFSIPLRLRGSQSLKFTPSARETDISLASNWPDPSFSGSFLPTSREVTEDGFEASWHIPHLARSVPQSWLLSNDEIHGLNRYEFGVTYYQPVDFYQLVSRSLKYAVLFIAIVFAAVFVLEALSGARVHVIQYLFVGLSQIVFYLLLLSFAEHVGFVTAYMIASVATVGLLTFYTGIVLKGFARGGVMLAVLCATYGLLYFLLKLQDFALLVGSIAVFVILAITMFTTLRLDWYGLNKDKTVSASELSASED